MTNTIYTIACIKCGKTGPWYTRGDLEKGVTQRCEDCFPAPKILMANGGPYDNVSRETLGGDDE